MKTVTFCGHKDILMNDAEIIRERVRDEVEKLVGRGADPFLLGGYGNFDIMCAKIVREFKEKYPHITSVHVVAYMDKPLDTKLYDYADFPPLEKVPLKFAIPKRNQYMVKKADAVVAYVKFGWGGSAKTLEYAEKKKKEIIRIQI